VEVFTNLPNADKEANFTFTEDEVDAILGKNAARFMNNQEEGG